MIGEQLDKRIGPLKRHRIRGGLALDIARYDFPHRQTNDLLEFPASGVFQLDVVVKIGFANDCRRHIEIRIGKVGAADTVRRHLIFNRRISAISHRLAIVHVLLKID